MKAFNLQKFLFILMLLTMILLALIGIGSCTATKKVNTSKQSFDSAAINILKDSVRNLKKEIQTLKQTISEKETVDVVFDNTVCPPCPDVVIPKDLNTVGNDSLINLVDNLNDAIAFYNNYSKGLENKVKIFADGTKEYSGKLKSYKQSDEKKQEIINNLIRESDSLRDVLQQNNTTVAKVTETKTKEVEVVVFPWYFWLITGGFALLWLNKQFKILG